MASGFLQFGSFDFDLYQKTQSTEKSNTVPEKKPSPEKSFTLPPKKKGVEGERCTVKTNHFLLKLPKREYHKYEVTITPDYGSRSRYNVMNRAKSSEPLLRGTPAVYDGKNSLYTTAPLPFTQETQEEGTAYIDLEGREYKVVIKTLHTVELQEAMNTVLGEMFASRVWNNDIVTMGRFFYSTKFGIPQRRADGLELRHGVYQSIKPTEMGSSLIIDTSSKAFITPQTVDKYVYSLLKRRVSLDHDLSDAERVEVEKTLRGIKIEVTHRTKLRTKYCISGLTPQATWQLNFRCNDTNQSISVEEYFLKTYHHKIKDIHLPCLQVGNQGWNIYLPMEVCKIVDGQRYTNRLNENGLLDHIRLKPEDCVDKIVKHGQRVRQSVGAKDFDISVGLGAMVEARVMPPPRLKYKNGGVTPYRGIWGMKKMVEEGTVKSWICINFVKDVANDVAHKFCLRLAQTCESFGMTFDLKPVMLVQKALPNEAKLCLKTIFGDANKLLLGKQLDLVIFILPDNNGPLYGDVKRICETDVGVVSQCCLRKHVMENRDEKRNLYFANVSLKINVKVGGNNVCIADKFRNPCLKKRYTIILGADVAHPGENSSPSIAAVVASQDWPTATKYFGSVRAQPYRVEFIEELCGMIINLLESHSKKEGNAIRSARIIFFRGGVSESKIYQVLSHELDAINQACKVLCIDASVTYVFVNKRHHTRLFSTGISTQNVEPGTVVDSKICNQGEFDFYMCSQAGDKNVTSRPAHYRVLHDDNKFEADDMQLFTNYLCYMNARCTRSVSIVAPAHYARLLSQRGGHYIDPKTKNLASLKDNLKKVMFFI